MSVFDLFADIRERTLRDLSREATANRIVILDALFAQAEMEDEGGEEVISIEEEDEDEEEEEEEENDEDERVVPFETRKRKSYSGTSRPIYEEEEEDNYEDQKVSKQLRKKMKKSSVISLSSLGSKAVPFSCQIPDCDRVGLNFHGVTEADRRAAGEAHIKSKHQEYVDEFRKLGGRMCDICGIGYEGTNAGVVLSNHRKNHDSHDWKECTFCPYSSPVLANVTRHSLICSMNPDRSARTAKCKLCNNKVGIRNISCHLSSHHGIGKFFRCLFCDYENYDKNTLVKHIHNMHKDKPTITSFEATREIVFGNSYPFVMRNGSGRGGGGGRR